MVTDGGVILIAHISTTCKEDITCPGCMYSLGWKDAFKAMEIMKKS